MNNSKNIYKLASNLGKGGVVEQRGGHR